MTQHREVWDLAGGTSQCCSAGIFAAICAITLPSAVLNYVDAGLSGVWLLDDACCGCLRHEVAAAKIPIKYAYIVE